MRAIERLRAALEAHLDAEADAQRAFGTPRAPLTMKAATRSRRALGTGEAREWLDEARSARAIDEDSHGAFLAHLSNAAALDVLSHAGIVQPLCADDRIVVADRERTLLEIVDDVRAPDEGTARRAVDALAGAAAADRTRRVEALDEIATLRARIRARGPGHPDDADATLAERCTRFLDATDDAASEAIARAHHAVRRDTRTIVGRVAALAPPALDGLLSRNGRAERVSRVLARLGLASELSRRVSVEPSRALSMGSAVVSYASRAVVLTSPIEAGIVSERSMLGGSVEALVRALASPALAIEHARAPFGSAAQAARALFEDVLADRRFAARHLEASTRDLEALRAATTVSVLLDARGACASFMCGPPSARHEERAREICARALVLDRGEVPLELARATRTLPPAIEIAARARLAALSWVPALRERYDEDWFRNPRLGDFVRGLAARGGIVSAETIGAELGATPGDAGRRAIELVR